MDNGNASLCRICLSYGAIIPIFEESCKLENDIQLKLSSCVCEKVKNIEGYPRYICTSCNNTLDLLFKFINKYKQSQQLLENSKTTVKYENTEETSDIAIEFDKLDNIKTEVDDSYDVLSESDFEDTLPLKKIKIKMEPRKKQTALKTKVPKLCKKNKTASAILEGDFSWNGNKCLKIGQTTLKKLTKQTNKNKEKPAKIEPNPKKPPAETKTDKPQPKKSEPKLCDLCGETFKDSCYLSKHKENVHNKNPMQCPQCPRICSSAQNVAQHIKRNHSGKNLLCPTCNKPFSHPGMLKLHIKNVHNKHLKPKRKWTCKFCGKEYKCPASVIVHERSVHTGERPAVCTVCDATFYHDQYLKQHMRLHTGETPFKCPICGRGYAQSGNMKSHLRTHRRSEIDPDVLSKLRQSYLKRLKM